MPEECLNQARNNPDLAALRHRIEESSEWYKALADTAQDIIFVVDTELRVQYINRFAARQLGGDSEQFTTKHLDELFPPTVYPNLKDKIKNIFESGESLSFEEKLISEEKEKWLNIIIIPIKVREPGISSALCIACDISKDKLAEEALRTSEANYRAIFDAANDAIFVLDMDTWKIVDVNRKGCEMFCYAEEEMLKVGLDVLNSGVTPYTQENAREWIEKAENGQPQLLEWLAKDKAGRIFLVEINLKRAIIGGRYRLLAIVRDINERKDTERKLKAANLKLLRANRRLKRQSHKEFDTGLYTYRYIEENIESEFQKAKRSGYPISVILIKIGGLEGNKKTAGPEKEKNAILKRFSISLKKSIRQYDLISKSGDNEFIVVVSNTPRAKAVILAERLFSVMELPKRGKIDFKLSASVAAYPFDEDINKGIDLLYKAKRILDEAVKAESGAVYTSLTLKGQGASGRFKDEVIDYEKMDSLRQRLARMSKRKDKNLLDLMYSVAKIVESRDRYTQEHENKLVETAEKLARSLGLDDASVERVKRAAKLRDLGKMGISEKILLKRKKLSKEEFDVVKRHSQLGADLLIPMLFIQDIVPLILYHHERWDGKGYPAGLKGREIPIGSRIISVAEAYHAMLANRPYRKAYPEKKAAMLIKNAAGTQFDPEIVKALLVK